MPEDCSGVFARLSEYLDGELPPEVFEKMQAHIEDCAPCVEFVESLRRSVDICKAKMSTAPPKDLSAECRDALLAAYREKFAK